MGQKGKYKIAKKSGDFLMKYICLMLLWNDSQQKTKLHKEI